MTMWKHLRIESEIAAAWLLTYEKTNDKRDDDADVLNGKYDEYEYEYEEDA
jgi:hypothetical protein